jgi:hypothetical protein
MTAALTFVDRQTVITATWLNAVNQFALAAVTKVADYSMANTDA